MPRLVTTFFLLSLLLGSVGCQVCNTPYDCCIPAYIDRPGDFRGCGPMYRAGSVLSGDGDGICQTSFYEEINLYNNAGNYGITTPISMAIRITEPSITRPPRDFNIGVPWQNLRDMDWNTEPRSPYYDEVPTIEELRQQHRETDPMPIPLVPHEKTGVDRPSRLTRPSIEYEIIPFTPNDTVVTRPGTLPTTTNDVPITLEELQRLDPTVRDMQIISIEDAFDTLLR